jgi:hypothetical protein
MDHIIRNYNYLSDLNVFAQAEQSADLDGNKGFRKAVESLHREEASMIHSDGFAYFGHVCLSATCGMFKGEEDQTVRNKYDLSPTIPEDTHEGLHHIMESMLQKDDLPEPDLIRFNPGAVFVVTRARILSNPVEYYVRIRDYVLGEGDHPSYKKEGVVIERSWPMIFNSWCSSSVDYNCALNLPKLKCVLCTGGLPDTP